MTPSGVFGAVGGVGSPRGFPNGCGKAGGFSTSAALWSNLHSTNVLERLDRKLGTRTRAVGIVPSQSSLLRFLTALPMEIDDDRRIDTSSMSERSMAPLQAERPSLSVPAAGLVG
ncbi:MAG TPA: transposase [Thermoanaerobaculaceae bacterium]|nr:transposase [Thermoanaerobaculaceae bacterium]HRS16005.1 transposase [Thermoanaerobaculaceae bacterium]